MTLPIAIVGTPGRVTASWHQPTQAVFAETGMNTGNLAFQLGVARAIGEEARFVSFDFDPAALRETARLVCVPAANFLYAGFDLGGLADRLAATGLPLMVLGLGAQAFKDVAEVKLQPGTERLLHLFGERCARIMVRGRHTGAVLERYGVRNFEVLGCPSNFISPDPALGAGIRARYAGARRIFAYAPTFYSYNTASELLLLRELRAGLAEIVVQDPLAAVAAARGDRTPEVAEWLAGKAGFFSALPVEEREALLPMLRASFCAEAWLEGYRRMDAVVGTRIHGVNLGWQAGRAACVVSYDLRTEELAETMGIPFLKADALRPGAVLDQVAERVDASAASYDSRRRDLAGRFAALLSAHGVKPATALRELAGPVAPAAPPPPARRAWGFLEQYNRACVAGWVAASCDTPPMVLVRLDGQEVGRVQASRARPEIGPHAWSFELPMPADALVRDVMRVEAWIAGDGPAPAVQLQNSPVVTSFHPDDAAKVLRGKDGWLFLRNDTNGVLDQIQGRSLIPEDGLRRWADFLRGLDALAMRRGIPAWYMVAPAKECVFASHLPDGIALSEDRPVRLLQRLAASLDLQATRLLYPLEELAAPSPLATYPKGDSHWSDHGAALALRALFQAAEGLLGPAPTLPAPDGFRTEYRNADLLSKLGGVCIEPQPIATHRWAQEMAADNGVTNTGRQRSFRSRAAGAEGRLLLLHDSFGEWLIPPLAERFATMTALWSPHLPTELVETVRPTALLFERAERFLLSPPRLG